MGLEAYLMYVYLKEEKAFFELEQIFSEIELLKVHSEGKYIDDFRSLFFEKVSKDGITEILCRFAPNEKSISKICFRFSVASPAGVIDQTFEILMNLNCRVDIKILDTELFNDILLKNRHRDLTNEERAEIYRSCYIPLDKVEFIENRYNIYKRNIILDCTRKKGIVRSGDETIRFMEDNNLNF